MFEVSQFMKRSGSEKYIIPLEMNFIFRLHCYLYKINKLLIQGDSPRRKKGNSRKLKEFSSHIFGSACNNYSLETSEANLKSLVVIKLSFVGAQGTYI